MAPDGRTSSCTKRWPTILQACINRRCQLRVTVAADMELETKCLQAVRLLLTEAPLWSELPTPCLHVAHRCLIFRMASRIGCCVEQMLRAQHRSLPNADAYRSNCEGTDGDPRVFAELLERSLLEGVHRPWRGGVRCLDGNRRTVQGRLCTDRVPPRCSAAVPKVTDADPSDELRRTGQLMAQRHRSGKTRYAPGDSAPKRDAKARRQRSKKQKGWKSGGGGGQRKYFSVQLRARKLSMQTPGVVRMLHAECAALTPEERAPYMRDGKAATMRWRTTQKRYASTSSSFRRRRRHAREKAQARTGALWNRKKVHAGEQRYPRGHMRPRLLESGVLSDRRRALWRKTSAARTCRWRACV